MSKRRRSLVIALGGALLLANRGCAGTNTGNADCGPPDACLMPVTATGPNGEAWRGTASLDTSGIQFMGDAVSLLPDGCEASHTETLNAHIPLPPEESSVGADGGLRAHYVDPRDGPTWMNGRPQFFPGSDTTYVAFAMDLEISADGFLRASLEMIAVAWSLDGGFDLDEVGTYRIEGPLSVDCRDRLEVPVASGKPARVRCAIVAGPETSCDDTRVSTFGCAVARYDR